jgi:single-strand DNA-binding protein
MSARTASLGLEVIYMPTKKAEKQGPGPDEVNEVRLVGRVAAPPELAELPSGDIIANVRVVVRRPEAAFRGPARVDALECTAWSGRVRRSVASWSAGDLVEVTGALRRRFRRDGAAVQSRWEVELASGRVIRRARSG